MPSADQSTEKETSTENETAKNDQMFTNNLNIELRKGDIVVMGHGVHEVTYGEIDKFVKSKRTVRARIRYFDKEGELYEAGNLVYSVVPETGLPWFTKDPVPIHAILMTLSDRNLTKATVDEIMNLTEREYEESNGLLKL